MAKAKAKAKPKAKPKAKAEKPKEKEEKKVGIVSSYYSNIGVAAIELEGPLAEGDTIHIKGFTTDIKQKVESMQINRKPVKKAKKNDSVGIKVKDRVRPNDIVYKV